MPLTATRKRQLQRALYYHYGDFSVSELEGILKSMSEFTTEEQLSILNDPTWHDPAGGWITPLWNAVYYRDLLKNEAIDAWIAKLKAHGATLRPEHRLMLATKACNVPELIQHLQQGVETDIPLAGSCATAETAWEWAITHKRANLVRLMLEHGTTADSGLVHVIQRIHEDPYYLTILAYLLANGPDLSTLEDVEMPPFSWGKGQAAIAPGNRQALCLILAAHIRAKKPIPEESMIRWIYADGQALIDAANDYLANPINGYFLPKILLKAMQTLDQLEIETKQQRLTKRFKTYKFLDAKGLPQGLRRATHSYVLSHLKQYPSYTDRLEALGSPAHPPTNLCCPISQQLMNCPVRLDGVAFDFGSLQTLLQRHYGEAPHPTTREMFTASNIAPAPDLHQRIAAWLQTKATASPPPAIQANAKPWPKKP